MKHGRRSASKKIFKKLLNFGIITHASLGEVSELADEHDLGSCAERHGGSSPPFPTKDVNRQNSRSFSNESTIPTKVGIQTPSP